MAQSVKHPASAQVMILRFVSSSPTLGSLLSVQSLLRILCLPLSGPHLSKINKTLKERERESDIACWVASEPVA